MKWQSFVISLLAVGLLILGCDTDTEQVASVDQTQATSDSFVTATPKKTPEPTVTLAPSNTPIPTQTPVTPTITPLPTETKTPVPTNTSTPLPPTTLAYTISVIDPSSRTVYIRLEVENLFKKLPILTFWTNAGQWSGDWIDPMTNIENMQASDGEGNPLPTSIVDDGIHYTGDGLYIDTQDITRVVIEYDTVLGVIDQNFGGDRPQLLGGYMNSQFSVSEPEFLLMAPINVETKDYVMTAEFSIGEDQLSVSHWNRLSEHTYSIDAAEKAFSYGAIAFGQILSEEEQINQTEVKVAAYGVDAATFEQISDNTIRIFRYYAETFGPSHIPGFVLIFVPEIIDNQYVSPYNEQSGGFFNRYLPWYGQFWSDNIAHPISHNWVGGGIHGEQWFQEGFVNYYELKSCEALGIYPHSTVQKELADKLNKYKSQIVGTDNDLSLTDGAEIYNQDHDLVLTPKSCTKG